MPAVFKKKKKPENAQNRAQSVFSPIIWIFFSIFFQLCPLQFGRQNQEVPPGQFFFQEFFFKISTEIFPGVLASQNLNASAIIDQKLIPGETVVLSAGPPVASLHVEMRWSVIKGGMLVGFLDLHMECRLYCLLL